MRKVRLAAWIFLAFIGVIAILPDFFSPYSPSHQYRDFPYAPPGRYHGASVHWFVHGEPYRWLGLVPASVRLFGSPEPGRLFVLGTDEFGRDAFSRLCHGASVSLLLAPMAALLSIALAVVFGAWAGMCRGVVDVCVTRISEAFVVLPWFYVVVALRAALPLSLGGPTAVLIVFALLAALGCATPSRLFRGLVLSLAHREFVLAARATGASRSRVLSRHILPFLWPAIRTQLLMSIPVFIITEVTLSFLGLGVADPMPTWGGMLVPLQQYVVLTSYPWMWMPAVAIVSVCLALQIVARESGDPSSVLSTPASWQANYAESAPIRMNGAQ
ncbi:MAG: ABC transporter permease [Acidobacteriia bacterium]|nr:ABC transporter permease [Terriglobia bacterium]